MTDLTPPITTDERASAIHRIEAVCRTFSTWGHFERAGVIIALVAAMREPPFVPPVQKPYHGICPPSEASLTDMRWSVEKRSDDNESCPKWLIDLAHDIVIANPLISREAMIAKA